MKLNIFTVLAAISSVKNHVTEMVKTPSKAVDNLQSGSTMAGGALGTMAFFSSDMVQSVLPMLSEPVMAAVTLAAQSFFGLTSAWAILKRPGTKFLD